MNRYDEIWKRDESDRFVSPIPKEIRKRMKGSSVLLLGSGNGKNMEIPGFNVTGIEISKEGVKRSTGNVICADFFSYDFGYYDNILALQSINHGTYDQIKKLCEKIYKNCTLFGVKIASLHYYRYKHLSGDLYKDTETKETHKFIDKQTYIPIDGPEKGLVHYSFTPKQLEEMLKEIGFKKLFLEDGRHMIGVFTTKNR